MTALLLVLAALLAARLGLPALLKTLGLHPDYRGTRYRLPGRRALVVTTSQTTLDKPGRPGAGRRTGVFASEMTMPYYAFLDAGMEVDVASIAGGEIPVEPMSLSWLLASPSDRRLRRDPVLLAKVQASLPLAELDLASYDIVFLAGGWGAAYDFGPSEALGAGISAAWAAGKVVGGVCHGPLGLLKAVDVQGKPLVRDRRLTAVTDRQIRQLGIHFTPQHPERELRQAGALFEAKAARPDMFAQHVVTDGHLVTGQNQNAGVAVAQAMLKAAGGTPDH